MRMGLMSGSPIALFGDWGYQAPSLMKKGSRPVLQNQTLLTLAKGLHE